MADVVGQAGGLHEVDVDVEPVGEVPADPCDGVRVGEAVHRPVGGVGFDGLGLTSQRPQRAAPLEAFLVVLSPPWIVLVPVWLRYPPLSVVVAVSHVHGVSRPLVALMTGGQGVMDSPAVALAEASRVMSLGDR
ncbi:hypothetical protein GCM10011608_12580 [Micromonospora sonchi]|uniref:Uncharacterized protein n=1 Tax=Micromonospora sonchi TaxID=1763543 RepID=A0A917TPX8_9ACTN|nr:hypothetical protein GCM10011608_12580 [Micromonospora sonchi]